MVALKVHALTVAGSIPANLQLRLHFFKFLMQYPNHLLLDLNIKTKDASKVFWSYGYTKQTEHNLFTIKKLNFISNNVKFKYKRKLIVQTAANINVYYKKNKNTFTIDNFFDINFLRKERIYTKLKYSRCPQYDIVAGGWAALFAGLLGFLITEKFGIELVDGGDFYTLLMYLIFSALSLKPLLKLLNKNSTITNIFSPFPLITYFYQLFLLFILKPLNF